MMPRRVRSNLSLTVTGTNPFKSTIEKETKSADETFDSFYQRASGEKEEPKAEAKVKLKSNPILPTITKPRRFYKEDSKDCQDLFQVRYYDCPFQGARKSRNSSHRSGDSKTSRHTSSSDQVNHHDGDGLPRFYQSFVRPLLQATVLEGQRVNLRGKDELDGQETQPPHCPPHNKEIYTPCPQNDSRCEIFVESIQSKISSLKSSDEEMQPIFHLPRVNKYDTSPGNIKTNSVFSVFHLKGFKSTPIYSRSRDSWVPHRDKYYMNNSAFFQALFQQPLVLLRQPSPVAGIKMTLKEHEDSVIAAIQAVQQTNTKTSTAETKLTQQGRKLVVTLPPLC